MRVSSVPYASPPVEELPSGIGIAASGDVSQ